MIKNIISGCLVGIANIIPGVSGGTIIVLTGLFDRTMESISNLVNLKIKFKDKLKDIFFLLQVGIGILIGLVCFAKALEYLFVHYEIQTLLWFTGLIIFSIPVVKKSEIPNNKINYFYLILGILLILIINIFGTGSTENIVPLNDLLAKNINLIYILTLVGIGFIGGATMIFPGVSGSMVLLILGYYHLFKGYIANATMFSLGADYLKIFFPLGFIALGVLLGIVLSSMLLNKFIKLNKVNLMSFIIGLIIMSSIIIIPTSGYNVTNIITGIISFLFGGAIVIYIEKKLNN